MNRFVPVVLALVSVGACRHEPNLARARQAQGAVSAAATRLSQLINGATETHRAEAIPPREATLRMPALAVLGAGDSAALRAEQDAAHPALNSVRSGNGWALAWGDPARSCVVAARTDAQGQPVGTGPVLVHETQSDEEDVVSPAIAQGDTDTAMVWLDPANGRVRFVRLGADGHPAGRPITVADGLEMPSSTRMVWDGAAFAVAVGLEHGVYFERLDDSGRRIGMGVVVAEESAESPNIDALTPTSSGYTVSWLESGGTRREVHLGRDGHVLGPGTAGHPRSVRVASR